MSSLYSLLRRVLRLGLDLYFVEIQSTGAEHIPAQGPVIFAANHPNSIMDTVVLGSQTPRQIHYMARSGLFHNPVVARVFDACGVIPLYRAQDGGDMSGNQDSFIKAYELMERGGCLGIFPEGQNSEERRVLRLKTGTARIALGAEARCDYGLDVQIVPVGLNFEDRDQFLSSVLVRFGEPIRAADWADLHREDEREAARALTDEITARLQRASVHIEDGRVHALTSALMRIAGKKILSEIAAHESVRDLLPDERADEDSFKQFLLTELRATSDRKLDLNEELSLKQLIADALTELREEQPETFMELRRSIWRYEDHLRQVDIRRDFWERHPNTLSSRKDAAKMTLYATLFSPFAFWGFFANALPYLIARTVSRRAPDEAIRAITAFGVGSVLFPLYHGLVGWLVWTMSGALLTAIAVAASMILCGFFFFRYRRVVGGYRARILTRTLFLTRRRMVQELYRERARVLGMARDIGERYLEERARRDAPAPSGALTSEPPDARSREEVEATPAQASTPTPTPTP